MTDVDLANAMLSEPLRRALLSDFLLHLHETSALSAPPSPTWIDAYLERLQR